MMYVTCKRIVVSSDGKRLLGMLVGDASDYDLLHAMAAEGSRCPRSSIPAAPHLQTGRVHATLSGLPRSAHAQRH